jgi:hypothetical protein
MKKRFTSMAVIAALALSFTLKAQDAGTTTPTPPDPNAPVMTFEKDTMDYGTIPHNGEPVRIFKFKNTGKEPLIISGAQGSCGCTVPTAPINQPIQPGESSEIKVHYATDRIGYFYKWVTLTSNAKNPSMKIYIMGTVQPDPPKPADNTTAQPAGK